MLRCVFSRRAVYFFVTFFLLLSVKNVSAKEVFPNNNDVMLKIISLELWKKGVTPEILEVSKQKTGSKEIFLPEELEFAIENINSK